MVKLCENCNNEINDHAFCLYCGLAQKCTTCNRPFDQGAKFCGKCGADRKGPVATPEVVNETKSTTSGQVSHQGEPAESSGQPFPPEETNRKKFPPMAVGIIIAALVFIAIIASNAFSNPEKAIEKTVGKYMTAVETSDYQAVKKLYHPDSPYMEDIRDFLDIPTDLTIEIHEFNDFDIGEEYAEVTALVSMESLSYDEKITEDVYIELQKHKNDWYIYDVY